METVLASSGAPATSAAVGFWKAGSRSESFDRLSHRPKLESHPASDLRPTLPLRSETCHFVAVYDLPGSSHSPSPAPSVYPLCTSLPEKLRFWRFSEFVESITYVFSTDRSGSSPARLTRLPTRFSPWPVAFPAVATCASWVVCGRPMEPFGPPSAASCWTVDAFMKSMSFCARLRPVLTAWASARAM